MSDSGDRRVNQGGEPAHDDYGLPPVDIEIPDDARELDRDVQAYHRELRALRRHERSYRWRAPLRHGGMVVPLMAGCLILAMVAGMVLTMFSANPPFAKFSEMQPARSAPSTVPSASHAGASSAPPSAQAKISGGSGTAQAASLPRGSISVGGQRVALSTLKVVALAIVPINCGVGCRTAISRLLIEARLAEVRVYLVGRRGVKLSNLAAGAFAGQSQAAVATDPHNVLSSTYKQAGLVIVLVGNDRRAIVEPVSNPASLARQLMLLGQAG